MWSLPHERRREVLLVLGKVAVIGQGYVGLPLAYFAHEASWEVIGIDKSSKIVNTLAQGSSHIEDISDTQLGKMLASGRYSVTSDFSNVSSCDICVVCVPTPVNDDKQPDLSFLESAIREAAPHLKEDALLVSESTSFPGTVNELIVPILRELRADKGARIQVVSAPERIDPRNKLFTVSNTPRLVGGTTPQATTRAREFYSTFCESVIEVTSPEVAEFAKLLENTFRQVNIALVNQLVPFAKNLGVDMREVVEASGSKPYGFMKFFHGAGVGGHCIPVDPLYLLWRARKEGLDLPFISQADLVNSGMPTYVVQRLLERLGNTTQGNVVVLGVAYKSGLSDIRETPAKDVADELQKVGLTPKWLDPYVDEFYGFEKFLGGSLVGAIVVTAQEGLPVRELAESGVPILDCTGVFKGITGVEQL
jgi:UDP-N-acetyl-D-glucosamine dehydrogenase